MTDVRITQCPKCDTTFRVSPTQLNVAKGAVRCGACLNVFNAADHFQSERALSTPKQDDRTEDMFNESGAKDVFDDALIHDDMDDNILINDDDDAGLLIDDDSGLDLIDDDNENEASFANDLNEEFLSLDSNGDNSDPFFSDADKVSQEFDNEDIDDESWAEALLDDDEELLVPQDPKEAIAKPTPKVTQQLRKPAPAKVDLDSELSEAASIASDTTAPANQFQYIQADPLELNLPDKKARRMRWVWLGLSLVAALGLCIQMAFFHFEQWSRDPNLRPWYQMACKQLDCQLPPIYDLSQIRTTATPRVSSHPQFEQALSVDVLFMNHAGYEQPFPVLQLSFTDQNGQLVAQRQFQPVEYLAGEAAGMNMMPSLVPVHIALEIKDPGPTADNYQVSFLQNN